MKTVRRDPEDVLRDLKVYHNVTTSPVTKRKQRQRDRKYWFQFWRNKQ